jgi:uncharacterized protein YndB with AHSA1/START domain
MVTVEHDVQIGRSPIDVFAYITRVESYADWQRDAGIERVTRQSADPIATGSTFRMERRARGGVATIDALVTAFELGRRFDFHTVDNDGFVGDFSTTLTPADGGTQLHWSARMEPPNLRYRLLQPLIAREIRKSAALDFPNLKAALEARADADAARPAGW